MELPAAPSRRRPHIPAAVPESETSQHQENLQLPLLISTLVLTAYLSAIYILRHEPFRHYHIIQLAGTNKNTSFVVGGSSCVRLLALMYSTGIPSSQLGTKSLDFVLNWILKFALGNKKAPVLYSTGIQATSFKRDIPDCPVVSPNSCTLIGLLGPSMAGQCAAGAEIGGCCTGECLLRPWRGYRCATVWRKGATPQYVSALHSKSVRHSKDISR